MKVMIMTGEYDGKIGNLECEREWGKWSTVHIPGIAVVFKDKIFLRKIQDADNKN